MSITINELREYDDIIKAIDLGPGWAYQAGWVDPENPNHVNLGKLVNPGFEAAIYFSTQYNEPGKLHIGGVYPKDSKGKDVWPNCGYSNNALPSINVSVSKGAKAIASDITRRFIPTYLEKLSEAILRRDTHEAYLNQLSSIGHFISAGFPGLRLTDRARGSQEHNWQGTDEVTVDGWQSDPRISAKVHSDTVEVTLGGLSKEQAREVLALALRFQAENKGE